MYFAALSDGIINRYFFEGKAKYLPVLASRNNTNPFVELKSLIDVKNKVNENKIDAAIIYGIKNHSAMAIGCKLGGVKKIISVVNGRGNLFTAKGIKGKLLRLISFPMLKIAYICSDSICFQNEDDANFFVQKHLVKHNKVSYTDGSGVNTELFPMSKMPENDEFLYLARITPSKGLKEYIEAAEIVKEKYPKTVFHVVGPVDDLIEDSVRGLLDQAVTDGIVEYHGKRMM